MDVRDAGQQCERDGDRRGAPYGGSGGGGFGLAVSRAAVAQLCESAGFRGAQGSAIDVLAEVAVRYVRELGRSAQLFANLSGRAECSAVDVVQALGDLGSVLGFTSAGDAHRCVIASGVLRDVGYYLSTAEEVPFARRVLNFPIAGDRRAVRSFAEAGEALPSAHIPNWLPVLPDRNTYDRSLDENAVMVAPKAEREEQAGRRRKVAPSVLALRKLLGGNRGDAGVSMDDGDFVKEKRAVAEGNPFLAPPLPFGAREVSRLNIKPVVAIGMEEKGLQCLAPPTDVENGGLNGVALCDDKERVLSCVRPTVRFKLESGKRSLASSLPVCFGVTEEPDSRDLWNAERNDKKHRKDPVHRKSTKHTWECSVLRDPS